MPRRPTPSRVAITGTKPANAQGAKQADDARSKEFCVAHLIGDGQLPHPGAEKILEAYYS
jgi:hypothetical protein